MLIFVTLLQVTKDNEFQFGFFSYVYYLSYIFLLGKIGCDYGFIYSMFSYDLFAFNVLTV